jgi:hypothetical protein
VIKILGLIVAAVVLYFLVDHALEYRYWKETQKNAFSFTQNVVDKVKNRNREDLETEFNNLKSSFDVNKNFSSNHEKVEKLARMYVLNETLFPQSRNPVEFHEPYIKVYPDGLALVCHYDLLIHLYQKEMGLPVTIRNDLEFNNVCYGWNKLDTEFGFWDSPHAYKALRY